jgi:hypothetical protein
MLAQRSHSFLFKQETCELTISFFSIFIYWANVRICIGPILKIIEKKDCGRLIIH